MKLPKEVPVMTLPNATLFPQASLPLYIFEPRYQRMLADVLDSHRLFAVAMRKPGAARETPLPVAGLGLVRMALDHANGTSHLVLQGVARVALGKVVSYRPYRVHRIEQLFAPPSDRNVTDALLARLRELIAERLDLGLPFPVANVGTSAATASYSSMVSAKDVADYLNSIASPEQAVDLVSCTVLPNPVERQAILEVADVEMRLQRLIQFLSQEINLHRKGRQT